MVLIVQSRDLPNILAGRVATPGRNIAEGLDGDQWHWMYNALDSAITLQVHDALAAKIALSPHATNSYSFVRAMQAPALAMMRQGIAINQQVRQDETERYQAIRAAAQAKLDALADAVWGPEEVEVVDKHTEIYSPLSARTGAPLAPRTRVVKSSRVVTRPRGLNPASVPQVLAFFNTALKCPVEHTIRKTPAGNIRTPSANDKALRKWATAKTKGPGVDPRDRSIEAVRFAQPFVSLILTIRDADKMLGVLRTPTDADGRMRCSYNVAGTENGRWSSSANAFGRGTNLQNIAPTMRRMFCSDDGLRLISTDLEQAESRLVAGLIWQATGDRTYWDACESSDLHTTVCQMTWPELDWNSDAKHNRSCAEQPFPGLGAKFTYRDVAKRLGHGSNYRGSPFGIGGAVGVPAELVSDFQRRYFSAFTGIPLWHDWTAAALNNHRYLDTPLHRRRWFFGRPNEDKTLREAIAYVPQSTIGELLNLALHRVWARSLNEAGRAQLLQEPGQMSLSHDTLLNSPHLPITLLLQNHDAFLFQTPESTPLLWLLSEVKRELEIPIPLVRGDELEWLTIPGEFVTGWNWAYKEKSPDRTKWHFKDGNPDGLTKWVGSDTRTRQQRQLTTGGDWLGRAMQRRF